VDDLCLAVFRFTAAVDLIQQSVQSGAAQHFMLKFPQQSSSKAKSELLTFARWRAPLCDIIFDEVRVNSRVQNKTLFNRAENHENWFRRFEDVNS